MGLNEILFMLALGSSFAALLCWGFKALPGERWQILAAVPQKKEVGGQWQGFNLTWYGLFTAGSLAVAVTLILILLGALAIPLPAALGVVGLLCLVCLPAARLVARFVEGKRYGFTVGGATFVGVLLIPWLIGLSHLVFRNGPPMPVVPAFAAIAIGYTFGEGLGRLACISFGCCYGKPLCACSPLLRRLFANCYFIYSGQIKKIAYASGLEGHKVVPIQALTATIHIVAGLVALTFFLAGRFTASLLLATAATQLWRALSELLRADYRGEQKISAYQIMSLVAVAYVWGVTRFCPGAPGLHVEIVHGLVSIWNPLLLLALQALGIGVFLYTGRSMVTGVTLSFHVHRDRI